MPYRRTIMVVAYDRDARESIEEALREDGYRLLTVESQGEALRYLRTFRFGLILCSAEGERSDPWVGLEALRGAAWHTPVVIYSTLPAATFAERGFAGFLAKPCEPEALRATVRQHLPAPSGDAPPGGDLLAV